MNKTQDWQAYWLEDDYQNHKQAVFELIDNYLNPAPTKSLEIGCGLALDSEYFYKKYNTDIWLLDGNETNARDIKYGSAETFAFYNTIESLKESYDSRNLKYKFVDANNIKLGDEKFDLIFSLKSCGFHYPLDTYYELIKNHSTKETRLIFELRNSSALGQLSKFEVVETIQQRKKSSIFELKLK